MNGRKVENSNRMKDGNRRFALEEVEVQSIWKDYIQNLYYTDTQEQVVVHMCGFDRVWRGNYFRGELIRRTEVEIKVEKLKNGKDTGNVNSWKDDDQLG